jgi:SOS-response transcriptional repressor LexA
MPEMLVEEIDVLRVDARGEVFAWRVVSDAFADVSICTGDILIVRRVTEIADGDLIMTAVDGRRHICRAYFDLNERKWRLQTLSGSIWVPRSDIRLDGKVIALIRHV